MTTNSIRVAERYRDYGDEQQTEECGRCWRWGKSRGDILVYAIGSDTAEWVMKPCPRCSGTGRVPYGTRGQHGE